MKTISTSLLPSGHGSQFLFNEITLITSYFCDDKNTEWNMILLDGMSAPCNTDVIQLRKFWGNTCMLPSNISRTSRMVMSTERSQQAININIHLLMSFSSDGSQDR
jgi:hypothetical protein